MKIKVSEQEIVKEALNELKVEFLKETNSVICMNMGVTWPSIWCPFKSNLSMPSIQSNLQNNI